MLRKDREIHEAKLKALHAEGWIIPEPGDALEPDLEEHEPEPTDYRPGSAEKVLVMADRYAKGLEIFHDEDQYGCREVKGRLR